MSGEGIPVSEEMRDSSEDVGDSKDVRISEDIRISEDVRVSGAVWTSEEEVRDSGERDTEPHPGSKVRPPEPVPPTDPAPPDDAPPPTDPAPPDDAPPPEPAFRRERRATDWQSTYPSFGPPAEPPLGPSVRGSDSGAAATTSAAASDEPSAESEPQAVIVSEPPRRPSEGAGHDLLLPLQRYLPRVIGVGLALIAALGVSMIWRARHRPVHVAVAQAAPPAPVEIVPPPPPAPEPEAAGAQPVAFEEPDTAAPAAAADAVPANMGDVRTDESAKGHRVFIDGRVVGSGENAYRVSCGKHTVRIGSNGPDMPVRVPCGGEVSVR
jgi:hypothetical protein